MDRRLRRCFDLVIALAAAVVLAPVLAAAAVAVIFDSGRPVLYWQTRVGKDRRPFRIAKLRTMVYGADALKETLLPLNEATPPLFKLEHDPRLTRVGKLLRRCGIDELPQLWNVFRGEMALVGPRPLLLGEAEQLGPEADLRFTIPPGITGRAQVERGAGKEPFSFIDRDVAYVVTRHVHTDLAILVRTVALALQGRVE